MRSRCFGIVLAGLWLAGVSAIAPTFVNAQSIAENSATNSPDPRLNDFTFFAQNWRCETSLASQPKEKMRSSWVVLRELNDFWFFGLRADPDKKPTQHDTFGFNTILKKFGWTILGDDGRFGNLLSNGWEGDRMTWQGSLVNLAAQTRVKYRVVMTKTGNRSFESIDYVQEDEQGTWTLTSEQKCVVERRE